jgi:hypothetical protein
MFTYIQKVIFSLYERPLLRNWFYTFAFAVFVPVGLRFALLAWEFGGEYDRVMAVIAGLAVGCTTVVTLLRIWSVPPLQTIVQDPVLEKHELHAESRLDASEVVAMSRAYSARNRQMARGAKALGSPRTWRR